MFEQYYDEIRRHALDEYPMECCGLITPNGYVRVENVHPDPEENFEISSEDYNAHEILAIVHSHPNGPAWPTSSDMRSQLTTNVPWGIVVVTEGGVDEIFWLGGDPAPLVGRTFRHGISDCYELIRDWYREEKGIELKQFPRDWEWWKENENLYLEGFEKAGFVEVATPEPGDVFLAQVRSEVPNHGGIYLGEGLILHHLSGRTGEDKTRLSVREPAHRWQQYVRKWLRYAPKD